MQHYTEWFDIIDPRFKKLILPNAHADLLYSDGRWLEGPVYVPAARHVLFSDIPNNRVLRYNECDASVSTFQSPADFSNGHSLDKLGRVLTCEHLTRRVTRIEHDGTTTVLADRFEGKRLNSPNDVIASSSGEVWFTDPTYGISTEYEGMRADSEIGANNVYRLATDGTLTAVITDLVQPNGLAFSNDERILYVVDSGSTPARLLTYELGADGMPVTSRLLRECEIGIYDGFRVDWQDNIWTSAGDGVHCLSPQGELLGKIRLPETVSNVCFGGAAFNRLYITATRSLYAVYLNTKAIPLR